MIAKLLFLVLIWAVSSTLTLQEYAEFQRENPQQLLEQLQLEQKHYLSGIQKLMFTTPWNKKGHQLTIKYANKLAFVSPCWYTFKLSKENQPIFQNQYNYDQQYAQNLKQANPSIKLVPRVYLEAADVNFFQNIGSNKDQFSKAVRLIQKIITQKQFDGIVWDTPYNFFQHKRKDLNFFIAQFIIAIRKIIGSQKLIMFNMGNPLGQMQSLDVENYRRLSIDYLLIQNYDRGDKYIDMVKSSLEWSKKLKGNYKTMLMLQFFSVKVNHGPLSGQQVLKSLKRQGVLKADLYNGICTFLQDKTRRIYLTPCLTYFNTVLDMSKGQQIALGFWEGGNGLQNYYKFL